MVEQKMSKEEQIGFHKGAVDTLLKERQELYRLLTIVDTLFKMHIKRLSDLGVRITKKEEKSLEKKL